MTTLVPGKPTGKNLPARRTDWAARGAAAVLAVGVAAFYGQTFSVPLLYDDSHSIAENGTIRHLWPLGPALSPLNGAGVGGRPLLNLSYAVNYAFGGTAVSGYHLVNLLIHVLAAWTLFALVRGTLLHPILRERFGAAATLLALVIAAIWAWHPVQTESVTYLSERAESLMGLFYLLTLYCFLRGAEGAAGGRAAGLKWFSLCVLACLAGVATKEVSVTAPLLVFFYDRTFVSGGFSNAWRRHWPLYLALAATWLPLAYFMTGLHQRGVGFGQGAAWWAYGLTECGVIVKYLLLAFWPSPLVFDHGSYAAAPWSGIWAYALALAALLTATGWALLCRPVERGAVRLQSPPSRKRWGRLPRRSSRPASEDGRPLGFGRQAFGFAGAWFFLILAPTSSVVPVVGQPMAENRLYLPLAGVVAFAVLGAYAMAGRRTFPAFALAAAGLGLATVHRNRDYSSAAAIWSDTVAQSPANPRAHNNLGNAWANLSGRSDDAIAQFQEALRLDPNLAEAHNNLGEAWLKKPGKLNSAIAQFQEALRLKPGYAEAHNNLGNAWAILPGHREEAIAQFQEAVRLKPELPEAHCNLGNAWTNVPGRLEEAIVHLREAVRLKPDYPEAHNNLGNAWLKTPGRIPDAISQYEEALRLDPELAGAHFNLAIAWLHLPGHTDEAAAQLEAFLRFQPDNGPAREILARIAASSRLTPASAR